MLPLLSMALAMSVGSTVAQITQLPPTFALFALDPQSMSQMGCVTSTGNFTTDPLKCFPFRSRPTSATEAEILVMGIPCTVGEALTCYGMGGNDPVGLFTSDAGYLSTDSCGTAFSVDAPNSTGVNSLGSPYGMPLLVGIDGLIQLVLAVRSFGG